MQSNGHIDNTTKEDSEFEPSINEPHEGAPVVDDEQLRVLPENEEEEKEEILLPTTAVKTTKPKVSSNKRKSSLGRWRAETNSAGTTKQLQRQATQLDKITIMLHSIQKDMKSTIDKSATVTDKAATNSDVPDSEKYSKEKFYYSYYFIKKKDAKT